ncbi:hypothetical protein ACP4OV_020987 [Aristida adscensionis]
MAQEGEGFPAEAPPPPPPPYLWNFLHQNFNRRCARRFYCFRCERAVCFHCCDNHGAHHPGQTRTAEVRFLRQTPCICAQDVKGAGYDWSGIQRLKDGERFFIPLRRQNQPVNLGGPLHCDVCWDEMYRRNRFCSVQCRVAQILHGRGRELVLTLPC